MINPPDIIGKIPDQIGSYDENGNEITPTTYLPGWHVNFLHDVPEIKEYKLDPQPDTPYRIYAGGIMPVAYRFPDEETFIQFFPVEDVDA